jgi:hypothetical protein
VVQEQGERLVAEVQTQISEVDTTLKALIESTLGIPAADLTEANSLLIGKRDALFSQLDGHVQTIRGTVAKIRGLLDTHVQGLSETHQAAVAPAIADLQKPLNELLTNIGVFSTKISDTYTANSSEVGAKLAGSLQGAYDAIKSQADGALAKVLEAVGKISEVTDASTQELTGATTEAINEQAAKLQASVNTVLGGAREPLTAAIDASAAPLNLLREAWEHIQSVDLTRGQQTYYLKGEKSILQQVTDMIERAVSNIMVFVPTWAELDWKLVQQAQKKRHVSFRVYTDLDTGGDEVRRRAEEGITLWNYKGRDFIICIRDAEEVLLAPLNAGPKPTAVVSETKAFAEHFQEIVREHWASKATKYNI